ncbi:hypothetical protein [Desulfotomaculum copahuensis]|uniref:Uncharacterized protein n=1 Tax=Desulfotomaculum copahuensis TaxID=1838280 RepID=A0A1B7LKD4_9FIRM|nr:hypothetical protein [Desulfotomaculum copahuensis]OAT87036.1 hypothetical protein A6M21_01685 [Desulfotomaculum copahuensis]
MAANLDRLIKEIKSLSSEEKYELARRLNEEAVFDDQSWFWTPEWQAAEKEADDDIAAGRVYRYDNVDDLIRSVRDRKNREQEKCDL